MGGIESQRPLRVFFFPSPTPGHMIPLIDMAKLFSRHGVLSTVVTTPGNEFLVRPAIEDSSSVDLLLLPFPEEASHLLPDGKENFSLIPSSEDPRLMAALFTLRGPFEALLRAHRPDCVVSDGVHMWTADVALALGIPRLVFPGPGVFSVYVVDELIRLPAAHDGSVETLSIGGGEGGQIPHAVDVSKSDIAIFLNPALTKMLEEAERKSFGAVFNTFYALEPEYVELYRKNPRYARAWCVGPVALSNGEDHDVAADRGSKAKTYYNRRGLEPEVRDCLEWLDTIAAEDSVVYACFGSLNEFSAEQLRGIALGLEASGHPFVWVVRNTLLQQQQQQQEEEVSGPTWLPEGFESRVEGRGVVVKGWAPQVAMLNHRAVGAFVTHCGWNSTLEGVSAGLPMVTWPLKHDQFANEKFVTEVLKVGVSAGRGAELTEAVKEVMGGGGAEMRRRAKEYRLKAKAALEEGGSTYRDMECLIHEIRNYNAKLAVEKETPN